MVQVAAVAQIQSLAWELPYTMGGVIKMGGALEFPLFLTGLRNQHSVCEDAGLIPGLTQWDKDLPLPQATV